MILLLLREAMKGLSKKQLLQENQELREENARLRGEVELLRQKMEFAHRRVFGRSRRSWMRTSSICCCWPRNTEVESRRLLSGGG